MSAVLPSFLVIGAMKAGTDSLYEYLRRHPQVFMAETKELNFFVEELNWSRGRSWYEQQFAKANGAGAIGEASTSYAKHPLHGGVPRRIAEMIPGVRLIYLVRNPIERIRAQYLHHVLYGEEDLPIEEAVRKRSHYVEISRYALQIERYMEYFPPNRFLVVRSEDLLQRRTETMRRILAFLGVDGAWQDPILGEQFHRTKDKRVLRQPFEALRRMPGYRQISRVAPEPLKKATMKLRTRGVRPERADLHPDEVDYLRDQLRDDVRRLKTYLGTGFEGWGIA